MVPIQKNTNPRKMITIKLEMMIDYNKVGKQTTSTTLESELKKSQNENITKINI
jgi:hypothetical protein